MISSRLVSLIRKEFIQILRDPRTLILVLIIPIMQLILLGYAATNDVRNVPLAVFDHRASASVSQFDGLEMALKGGQLGEQDFFGSVRKGRQG